MKTRIIAGVIAAIGLTWLIFRGPLELLTVIVLLCATMAYLEFDRLFFADKNWFRQGRLIAMVLATIYVMQLPGYSLVGVVFWISFLLLCAYQVFEANAKGDVQASVRDLSVEVLGYLYTVALFGFLLPIIESGSMGREFLYLVFFMVFGGDTAAYFVGSRFGKHKLAPVISPGKSVEGGIASIGGAVLMAFIWLVIFNHLTDMGLVLKVLLFAPLGSILGQLGDLFESLLKRSQARKDSGSFLPGHGGILDRLDGLLLVAPVFYFYLTYFMERG